ncbi:cytochrome c oxidase subunit 3 [Nitrosospira multiformis]|uniref:Cytochrome c oxidase subunit 3 n=1 Tax=Nitrosospira multiformis TaxID=1231 RepID=A0A2T5IHW1_9PROT|nr:cytochrome c oxidase subunit 3 [Nitrosospira multiformis]PTQ83395.1 cytochrome c oxidase subunit 3 [Nitrosospira multiformis]
MSETAQVVRQPLPVGSAGKLSGGWWGMMALIVTEASLFGYLLFTYFYLAAQTVQDWPPGGLPSLLIPGINTVILLGSSVAFWVGERRIRQGKAQSSIFGFIAAIALGSAFVAIQLLEWRNKTYSINSDLYGSLYFTITGFHLCHVIIGLGVLLLLLAWTMMGYFDHKRHVAITIGGVYWHFVDVVWLFVFSALYLSPYLHRG